MAIITAVEYRRKNLNAYLDNVSIEDGVITSHKFYNPSSYEEGDSRFKGKPCDCEFDLEKLKIPDGYYILREANGHKESRSYLLIKNFQIEKEFNSESEMLKDCPNTILPKLEGSEAQIEWANNIRKKCEKLGINANFANNSAKYWIDNFAQKIR